MVIKAKSLVKNRFCNLSQGYFRGNFPTVTSFTGRAGRTEITNSTLNLFSENRVAVLTLNRPDANNRVDLQMAAELREACSLLAADDRLRVVILAGEGRVFSTGRETQSDAAGVAGLQVARAVAELPVPVLAALNGDASDHGLELALATDLRLAAPDARFWFSAPAEGMFPFDGGTQRLPRLVGPAWAQDMLLTGRKLAASEALAIGLVNRVAESSETVLHQARQLADSIVQGSPLGARYAKEAIMSGADMALPHALGLEADLNVLLQSTRDRAEGIASFLERREPDFTGE